MINIDPAEFEPGKLFRDCSEAAKLKRIHYSGDLLRKAAQGLDDLMIRNESHSSS